MLTNYLSISIDWGKSKKLELSSAKAAAYLLKNSSTWFEKVCGIQATRKWFEKCIGRGRKIYLVVGLRTIFDGRLKIDHTKITSTGGHAQLPADLLAGLPPVGLSVGGGGKVSKDQGSTSEFSAAGERIWALQYRQVKFKWYSSKKMETAALESGSRWQTFDRGGETTYYGGVEENDTEDVIEAVLDDELELGDQFDVREQGGEVLLIPK